MLHIIRDGEGVLMHFHVRLLGKQGVALFLS